MIILNEIETAKIATKAGQLSVQEKLKNGLLGVKIPLDVMCTELDRPIICANKKITAGQIALCVKRWQTIDVDPSPVRNFFRRAFYEGLEKVAL